MRPLLLAGLLAGAAACGAPREERDGRPARFVDALDARVFQRGNLHAHSTNSDGKSPPRDVYAWYRDHGYAFATLTDHNMRTDPEAFRDLEREGFTLVPGEEVTLLVAGAPVHVNALCTSRRVIDPLDRSGPRSGGFATKADALRWAVAAVRAQAGIALVNHPNFEWALTAEDLHAARGAALLEMWSGHPAVHAEGDALRPSEEAIWEQTLARGDGFAGVAVDDVHHLDGDSPIEKRAGPGRGWVEVFADRATRASVCEALGRGRLYASSGARLGRVRVEAAELAVWAEDRAAHVEFLGASGRLLASAAPDAEGAARYRPKHGDGYVRARVTTSAGKAWTQAYRVE